MIIYWREGGTTLKEPVWLLTTDEPGGQWSRASILLQGLVQSRHGLKPELFFLVPPRRTTVALLRSMGIRFQAIGRTGTNLMGVAWRLRQALIHTRAAVLHVWNPDNLFLTLAGIPESMQLWCEVGAWEAHPPWISWLGRCGRKVDRWFYRMSPGWQEGHLQTQMPWMMPNSEILRLMQWSANIDCPRVLLVAGGENAARVGLWAFDIFRHAWPESRFTLSGSRQALLAGREFVNTLGLQMVCTIDEEGDWHQANQKDISFVMVLGTEKGIADDALGWLHTGLPVVVENSAAIADIRKRGAPLQIVSRGDRSGLASALQEVTQWSGNKRLEFLETLKASYVADFQVERGVVIYCSLLDQLCA